MGDDTSLAQPPPVTPQPCPGCGLAYATLASGAANLHDFASCGLRKAVREELAEQIADFVVQYAGEGRRPGRLLACAVKIRERFGCEALAKRAP